MCQCEVVFCRLDSVMERTRSINVYGCVVLCCHLDSVSGRTRSLKVYGCVVNYAVSLRHCIFLRMLQCISFTAFPTINAGKKVTPPKPVLIEEEEKERECSTPPVFIMSGMDPAVSFYFYPCVYETEALQLILQCLDIK